MNIKISNIVTGFIISMLIWSVGTAGERIVVENVGFATPESVEYYAAEDVYAAFGACNGDWFWW